MPATYRVSTWDPGYDPDIGPFGWKVFATELPLWGLRAVIRELRSEGYSEFSYLVEKEDDGVEPGEATERAAAARAQ